MDRFLRNRMLFGDEGQSRLSQKKVTVFGVGGVGGYVIEMLARSGVGTLEIVDHDTISRSNINRQIIALDSTVGKDKVEVMAERIKEINPNCRVIARKEFFLPENAHLFDFSKSDFVVDAIDTVSGKIAIIEGCTKIGTPVISSMGTGNKLHPELLEISDISKTSVCPLARVMRRELKKRGIAHLPVLFSKEEPLKPAFFDDDTPKGKAAPASSPFVPSSAGILIASYVVRELLK
jgi:tRNA A37 threonylcarbamoyladenosine dehydratase